MPSLKKVSLKDVANAAGVSTTLVSFILNGNGKEYRVGKETAERVVKIAREMNYQPNIAAKSLRSGKTKTIGLVVSDISNPFFSQLARILEDKASKHGYTVLFGSSDEKKQNMERVIGSLINKGVDGLIIVPCENSESTITSLVRNNTPIVLFDRYFPEINVSYVALNNYSAAYALTNQLLASGFNAPCIVAYDINLIHMKERIRGYKTAMEDAGKSDQTRIVYLTHDNPRKIADHTLPKMINNGVDALLFATNMISLACLYTIKDMGEGSLEKIGMASFDENPAFDFLGVPTYNIRQPIKAMAIKAFDILIDGISNGKTVQKILAEGDLITKSI